MSCQRELYSQVCDDAFSAWDEDDVVEPPTKKRSYSTETESSSAGTRSVTPPIPADIINLGYQM